MKSATYLVTFSLLLSTITFSEILLSYFYGLTLPMN